MTWDTRLYFVAHNQVILSQLHWDNNAAKSIGHSFSARLAFALNLMINVLSFPLAILYVTFGSIIALAYWNFQIRLFTKSYAWIKTKTNHILLSALGTLLPSFAYRFRDANLAPYVIALRVALLTWGFLYALRQ